MEQPRESTEAGAARDHTTRDARRSGGGRESCWWNSVMEVGGSRVDGTALWRWEGTGGRWEVDETAQRSGGGRESWLMEQHSVLKVGGSRVDGTAFWMWEGVVLMEQHSGGGRESC